ncbi:apoptotic chromatin condensation inducer acinus isoform X1 [Megalopta genalis]|uniref:apoptotic chromatin condensation inducer acinus isoform X1 n=1 Tax=Megalopta genalis TaxID=115081 RepID=UPI003FD0BDE2
MRRKSERNKAKGTPEKEVGKPTRKSTRRRVKKTHSMSPEPETVEETGKSIASKETDKKLIAFTLQRKQLEDMVEDCNETVTSTETDIKIKSEEHEEDNDGGSVWKVARADASPGEIQKLKLCRQHNMTESSSDSSLSRKKSNKWQESGEGVAEEADSAEEQLVSCTRMLSSTEQPNDPSSSYPGQDSNEEVSDSKEILPETTSANLSDDKPNIDQQGESKEANIPIENADNEPIKSDSTPVVSAPRSNGDRSSEETNDAPKEEKSVEDTSDKSAEPFNKEITVENVQKDTSTDEEEDEKEKPREVVNSTSESNDEVQSTRSNRTSSRISCASRRKHRTKYRDSSNSDTPDSEDELPIKRDIEIDSYMQEEKLAADDSHKPKDRSVSPKPRNNTLLNNVEAEAENVEENNQKSDSLNEKSEYSVSAVVQLATSKPVKVNLKRSFSARILMEKNDVKKEDTDASVNNETVVSNKENLDNAEVESKCVPRKRRWGTALSTDTTPSFSISTDSLKALVPGARPLSINEVRLSKDDDEDRDRFRANEKWYNTNEGANDNKSDSESVTQKNGTAKKGDGKVDNHIAVRRKISIVKETPHIKSPSPPATKPTNILLIKNLVRPFTLNQIKELLSRTGTIVENGFWMDRIKSKCFVEYANEDQAFETRQALHGVSWPVSNPKRLHVEYATKDDMELARELSKDQSIPRKTETLVPDSWQQDWNREEKANTKVMVVREWDLGKEDGQHMKEKEREKKDHDKKRRQRSRSPAVEAHLPAPARKFKKKEDEPPPAKLLDDLFRKTKATPCIYWLPLTNEQIVVKEEMRRQHMAEHARRLEEMRRAERNNRDGRRRRSPRK